MGLLALGTPLSWQQSQPYLQHVKTHGIIQFINTYRRLADRSNDDFLWGDEIEYLIIRLNPHSKQVFALCQADQVLARLEGIDSQDRVVFHPEYGRFMIEATPGKPYGGFTTDIQLVESNMVLRRYFINSVFDNDNDRLVSMASFPLLGSGDHVFPDCEIGGPITHSSYVCDEIMNPHPRFPSLTANIRERRTDKVSITVPLFKDTNAVHVDKEPKRNYLGDLLEDTSDFIHMDAMAFGMGCCCLQVTFQCRNIDEARNLYDQLAVLSPIMLALTAASPFFKGLIADTDVRWNVICQSVDDRTPYERGLSDDAGDHKQFRVSKSRYSSIDCFLGTSNTMDDSYNDIPITYHDAHFQQLQQAGIDRRLSQHVAHLFVRDPLVIFSETIDMDDDVETDHFESIQSTNWNSVRFKPPPSHSTTGWRVEFRTMEVQITDFENAAFTVFVALLSRALLFLGLDFYIPISLVDVNMARAHSRDAVNVERFHIRAQPKSECSTCSEEAKSAIKELTIKEIMCGEDSDLGFPGLLSYITTYLDEIQCDKDSRQRIDEYIDFIEMRARGDLMTLASWMRKFVKSHPDYKHDSKLSHSIVYDLIEVCDGLTSGKVHCKQLLLENVVSKERIAAIFSESGMIHNSSGVPLSIDLASMGSDMTQVCEKIRNSVVKRREIYEKVVLP